MIILRIGHLTRIVCTLIWDAMCKSGFIVEISCLIELI